MIKMNTTIYASDFLKLDSNVYTGGGTDETEALQKVLDMASEFGRLHLIMDGAALIHGLRVHSNTTIECIDKSCGFYLADNSNCALLINYNANYDEIRTHNISLIGGTYNHNCLHQEHDIMRPGVEDESVGRDGEKNSSLADCRRVLRH